MNYQQTGFNLLTNRRPANLLKLMEIYERIIYSDIDIIWKSDPRPYFKGNFDFWAQLGGVIDGSPYLGGYLPYICTGFFALQRTKKTKKMISKWIKEMSQNPTIKQDQNVFQTVVFDLSKDFCVLPMKYFPCGNTYFEHMSDKLQKEVVIVHNNFIIGKEKKIKRFKDFNLCTLNVGW